MTTYTFQTYPGTAKAKFTCLSCGKENRSRTFRVECTCNPFNKNEDGTVKTPSQVLKQSFEQARAERDTFMRHPVCASCENSMSYSERRALKDKRKPSAPDLTPEQHRHAQFMGGIGDEVWD